MEMIRKANRLKDLLDYLMYSKKILEKTVELSENHPINDFVKGILTSREIFFQELQNRFYTDGAEYREEISIQWQTAWDKFLLDINAATLNYRMQSSLEFIVNTETKLEEQYRSKLENNLFEGALMPVITRHWKKIRQDLEQLKELNDGYNWSVTK